jgi:dipeptidyl aminopeptidase/acylaminoacyl peptidase
MTEKRLAMFVPLAALMTAVLACNPAVLAPAGPTAAPTEPPPPTQGAPTEAAPTEAAPTEAAPTATLAPEETPEPVPSPSPTAEPAPLVVYSSEDGLWVVEGEEPPRQLTNDPSDRDPKLSPDGRRVLFRRDVEPAPTDIPRYELRVIAVDGSGGHVLVGPEDLPGYTDGELPFDRLPTQTAWLADSQTVAFGTHMQVGYGSMPNYDLWLVDVEGGEETGTPMQLLADGKGGTFAFSPSASHVVVCTHTVVSMLEADGSNRRVLVPFEDVVTYSEYYYTPKAVWAPDGSYALVAISSPDPMDPEANATIWRLPLEGDAVPLGTVVGEVFHGSQSGELWSADRTRMVFTRRLADTGNERELIVAGVDGSDPEVYATGEVRLVNWVGDGSEFAFYQDDRTEVYRGSAGQAPVLVLPSRGGDGVVTAVRWVGSDAVVYIVAESGEFTVWLGPVGGEHRVIGRTPSPIPGLDVWQ